MVKIFKVISKPKFLIPLILLGVTLPPEANASWSWTAAGYGINTADFTEYTFCEGCSHSKHENIIGAISAEAKSEIGNLGVYAGLTDELDNSVGYLKSHARSGFVIDDAFISGPGDGLVSAPLKLFIDGVVSSHISDTPWIQGSGFGMVSASFSVSVFANSSSSYGLYHVTRYSEVFSTPVTTQQTGFLRNGWINGVEGIYSTDNLKMPIGQPFPLEIRLEANVIASGSGVLIDGATDFLHTIAFPQNIPLFDLPDGYSFNAPSARIIGNCIGECRISSVPLTSSLLFFMSSLIILAINKASYQLKQ